MKNKSGYSALAPVYDRLNGDVDYKKWADFIEKCFEKYCSAKPQLVLDLGCGTGSMTFELSDRGYDMTAIDISPDMLSEAMTRYYERKAQYDEEAETREADGKEPRDILFLCADMTDFELYGTVDAIVCCLDGINHLPGAESVQKCFDLAANYLAPGGVFVFDMNTPHKFRNTYADNDYILDDGDAVCCWQNRLNDSGSALSCDFMLNVFRKQKNGMYRRDSGVTTEYAYPLDAIERMLAKSRLKLVCAVKDYAFNPVDDTTDRWYLVAASTKNAAGGYDK